MKAQRFGDHLRLHHQGNVSEIISASIIIPLMMEAEMVSETLVICPQLTWLASFKSYML
jgi:hypothetical protein